VVSRAVRLPAAARVASPWSNGKGMTQEVVRSGDPGSGWRISIATIAHDAEFSDYTGQDRHLMPLTVGGLRLVVDGRTLEVDQYEVLSFDGHAAVAAVDVTAPSLDLNLMASRDHWLSSLTCVEVSGDRAVEAASRESLVVIALEGAITIDGETMIPYDAWSASDGASARVGGSGRVALARVSPR